MLKAEIPRVDWPQFLDRFSRAHDAWIASVEVRDPELGTVRESENLALEGIGFDPPNQEIVLQVAAQPGGHMRHVVAQPQHLLVWHGQRTRAEALEILSDGAATLVRVRPPVEEAVDPLSAC